MLGLLAAGVASLIAFFAVERRVEEPLFRLDLFRIRAFVFGTLSTFLSAIARGGLMFILILWLQGIWLPRHGYDFTDTPIWAGISMLPLTAGMLIAGPISGRLSDRYGARRFATTGMVLWRAVLLPPDPAADRLPVLGVRADPVRGRRVDGPVRLAEPGVGDEQPAGMGARRGRRHEPGRSRTLPRCCRSASFFTLMTLGLAHSLPSHVFAGLQAHGVSAADAHRVANLPPISVLFGTVPRL